jgi:hypothetical protein
MSLAEVKRRGSGIQQQQQQQRRRSSEKHTTDTVPRPRPGIEFDEVEIRQLLENNQRASSSTL